MAFAQQVEGEGLARFRVVEVETQLDAFTALERWQRRYRQAVVAVEFLGQQAQCRAVAIQAHGLDLQGHAGTGALGHFQILGADQVVRPLVARLGLEVDALAVGELVALADLAAGDGLVEQVRTLADQACLATGDPPQVLGFGGDEAGALVAPAHLLEGALGEHLAVVLAQQAVGVGHDLARRGVVAEQRAPGNVVRHRQVEIIEHRGGQVDMAVHPGFNRRQLVALRGEYQVEAPGRGQAHVLQAVGFVGGDDHQGVLEYALLFQPGEEVGHRVVQVADGGLLGGGVALQIGLGRGVGLVGTDGEQGEHPRLLVLPQLLDVLQRAFEVGLVVHAPGEFQVGLVLEPVAAMGLLEAHVRHDLVLGHEAQAGTLQEVGAETHHAQLVRQALLVAGLAGQQLDALGRARVQLLVVAAEHGVQAANGLVVVQHIVRRGHAALGPLAQARHQVFRVGAADQLTILGDIGAGDAFEGDDQHVARLAATRQQRGAGEVELGQAVDVRRQAGFLAGVPVLDGHAGAAGAFGQNLVRQVEQLPLVVFAGRQVLVGGMPQQQDGGQHVGIARQPWPLAAAKQQAGQHCDGQRTRQQRIADAAALGGLADELRVTQVFEVAGLGHAPHRIDQLGIAQQHQRPGHGQRCGQQGAAIAQQQEQAADAEVRDIAGPARPAQPVTAGQGQEQVQRAERDERCGGVRQPMAGRAHRSS